MSGIGRARPVCHPALLAHTQLQLISARVCVQISTEHELKLEGRECNEYSDQFWPMRRFPIWPFNRPKCEMSTSGTGVTQG